VFSTCPPLQEFQARPFYASYFLCYQENVIHSDRKRRGYAERDVKGRKDER
jgi:hypothetical protein